MNPKTRTLIIIGGAALVFLMVFASSLFVTIKPGEAGVLFKRFGNGIDTKAIYYQGFHVKAPWNEMIIYNIRKQQVEEVMDVLSSNGLAISVDVSIRYKTKPEKIGFLHNQIGSNYTNQIIIPEVRSATRKVIGKYTPEELYSSRRETIQTDIFEQTKAVLVKNFIEIDALLIRSVKLPPKIKEAIETKLEQEQQAKEYEFRLIKEKKEAERKKIEAKGIQDFQRIVTEGISEKLLKWKGIEATQGLAQSKNSKIVIIGGSDGLPVILNHGN